MSSRYLLPSSVALSFFFLISGCARENDTVTDEDAEEADGTSTQVDGVEGDVSEARQLVTQARAVIEPLVNAGPSGTVTFAPSDLGMQVTYMLDGLSAGAYGFHVHENGSCADGDDGVPGGAAGGHFNPGDTVHGAPNLPAGRRHMGDLGNVHAVSDQQILGSFNESIASLEGPQSIVGKALMIHAGEDDFTTQPTGNAGPRIGCGVIIPAEAS